MNDDEQLLHNLIVLNMQGGQTFERVKEIVFSNFSNTKDIEMCSQQLDRIYNEHIKGTEVDIKTKNLDGILNIIGLGSESSKKNKK